MNKRLEERDLVTKELQETLTSIEKEFGLWSKGSQSIGAQMDFVDLRKELSSKVREMSTEEKDQYRKRSEGFFRNLNFLGFRCGYYRIRVLDTRPLEPMEESMAMLSIFSSSGALKDNKKYILSVANYFSNQLANLDKETLQNKHGACYRLQRLFVLCILFAYPLGAATIAHFILMNLRDRGE